MFVLCLCLFFFSSRRRHTRCALVTGVQTCALPICFEEALLTGESTPVRKRAGAQVYAGTVCREHPARVHVHGVGADTRLSQLARLVEHAQAHRPPLARLAARISGWFVAALLPAALLVWLGWGIHDPSPAFAVTLALLVISCPCPRSDTRGVGKEGVRPFR